MEQIVFEKPYQFIPPIRTRFFSQWVQRLRLHQWHLRNFEGVESYEVRHKERLRESMDRGDAIIISPNHSRNADPMAVGWLTVELNTDFYAIANWHLFQRHFFEGWAIRLMGGYSIFREGMDRRSLETSLQILETAERPLMIFPEGSMTRNNDRLHPLLDGVGFIARKAAANIQKKGLDRRVVIHPVGVKYVYRGDLRKALAPTLELIEKRLGYLVAPEMPLLERVARLGMGMFAAKEVEILGAAQTGTFRERRDRLIDGMLAPLETKWGVVSPPAGVVARTKELRGRMLPVIQKAETPREEKGRVERDMERAYQAQQLACYPDGYFEGTPYQERLLETVERLEEDATGDVTVHGGLHVILDVDEPIVVSHERVRGGPDPLMDELASRMRAKLAELSQENHALPPEEIGDFRKYCGWAAQST